MGLAYSCMEVFVSISMSQGETSLTILLLRSLLDTFFFFFIDLVQSKLYEKGTVSISFIASFKNRFYVWHKAVV